MRLGKHYRGEYLGYGGAEILEDFAGVSPAGVAVIKNDFLFGPRALPRTTAITT